MPKDVLLTNYERDRDLMQSHIFSQSPPRMQFLFASLKLIKANAIVVGGGRRYGGGTDG